MDKLCTVIEAAEELGVEIHEVYELIKTKKLNAIKVGSIKILKNELAKYKDKNNIV